MSHSPLQISHSRVCIIQLLLHFSKDELNAHPVVSYYYMQSVKLDGNAAPSQAPGGFHWQAGSSLCCVNHHSNTLFCPAHRSCPAHPAAGGTEALLPFANIKNVLEKLLPKSPDGRKLPQSAQSQKHSSDGGAQGKKCLCRIHLRLVVRPPVLESQVSWEFRALRRQSWSKILTQHDRDCPWTQHPKVLPRLRCSAHWVAFGEWMCTPGCGTWGLNPWQPADTQGWRGFAQVPREEGGRENSPEDLLWVMEGSVALSKVG